MPETPLRLLKRVCRSDARPEDWERLVAIYSPLLRRLYAKRTVGPTFHVLLR
jgi:hypothetical protein